MSAEIGSGSGDTTPAAAVKAALEKHEWWLAGNLGVPGMKDATTYKCLCGWNGDDPRGHQAEQIVAALAAPVLQPCDCYACLDARDEYRTFMVLCPECGCKRCTKATNHLHACSQSNASGQVGSVYGEPCTEVCCTGFEASRERKRVELYRVLAAENPTLSVATGQETTP
jgi:hypothetical protein